VRSVSWIEFASTRPRTHDAGDSELEYAQRIAELADIAGRRGVIAANCLPQALMVHGLLRRRGLAPQLRIGVRKSESNFDAHAWVELRGVALGQTNLSHIALPRENWARTTMPFR